MLSRPRLAQFEVRAPPYYVHAVIDEMPDAIDQTQLARLAVDNRQHDHAEADLELRVLVEIVKDYLGLLPALQLEDDAQAVAVAFIAYFRNALYFFVVQQRGGMFNEPRLVDLIRNLGNDDLLAIFPHAFDSGARPEFELTAALGERLHDSLAAQKETSRGEIGARHQLENFSQR